MRLRCLMVLAGPAPPNVEPETPLASVSTPPERRDPLPGPVDAGGSAGPADAAPKALIARMPETRPTYETLCGDAPDAGGELVLLMGSKPPAKRVTVAFTSKYVRPGPGSEPAAGSGFTAYVSAPAVGLRREVFHMGFEGDPYQCCTKGGPGALTFRCVFSGANEIEARGKVTREGNAIMFRWCTADLSMRSVTTRGTVSAPIDPKAAVTFASRKPECAPPLPQ